MAVTGHKTLAEVQRYTESATREGLADSGMDKLMARPDQRKTVVNHPERFARKAVQHSENKWKWHAVW